MYVPVCTHSDGLVEMSAEGGIHMMPGYPKVVHTCRISGATTSVVYLRMDRGVTVEQACAPTLTPTLALALALALALTPTRDAGAGGAQAGRVSGGPAGGGGAMCGGGGGAGQSGSPTAGVERLLAGEEADVRGGAYP